MTASPPEPAASAPPRRRFPLFLLGALLFVLGPAIYFVQFRAAVLTLPWYVPVLATCGVALMVASLWQQGGWLRSTGLVLFAALCGMEWFMVFFAMRTPPYTGAATEGRTIPAFATTLADGTPFTDADLKSGMRTALVFFRGRW